MELKRRPNETPFDYHKRLVFGKLKDKTLSDVDYTELSKLVYGKEYSSDVARRMFYGSRDTLELLEEAKIEAAISDTTASDIIEELDEKVLEFQKEKQKFHDQRREFNSLVRTESRREHIYDYLSNAAANLDETIGSLDYEQSDDIYPSENDAILVLTDWHYGMVANNIFNEYNTEVCKQRVKKVVEKTIKRIQLHGVDTLHVFALGDLIHGSIHTSARVASEELTCDQLMQVSEIMAQAIAKLSQYVNKVTVRVTYGNHARVIQNKKDSLHRDNLERIIPWWLEQRLSTNDRVVIEKESPNEFLFLETKGFGFCAAHGDLDNVKSSPRVLGTLFQRQYGKQVDYILLGDKHHREVFDELGITSVICGSLCGADDYSNDKRLYSSPSQLLLIINEECGVDAEYVIKCS